VSMELLLHHRPLGKDGSGVSGGQGGAGTIAAQQRKNRQQYAIKLRLPRHFHILRYPYTKLSLQGSYQPAFPKKRFPAKPVSTVLHYGFETDRLAEKIMKSIKIWLTKPFKNSFPPLSGSNDTSN